MPHAIAYLRKSKSDDPSKEVSRDVQERAVRELAARDGYNGELELLVDWDRSADEKNTSRRTAYRDLLKRVEDGEVSAVYAYSVDRLYRSLGTFLKLTDAAKRHGVRIVTTREGIVGGDGSPMAQAFAQIGAVFTELELNTAKARAKSAYASRVARGDHVGRVPYGYRLVRDNGSSRLERDPARSVEPIIAAYEQSGRKARRAMRILNDDLRIPAPYGGEWDRRSILRVVERDAPHLIPPVTATGRREAAPNPALLAKLLRCHCGRLLTPNRHVDKRRAKVKESFLYYCARGHAARHDHPQVYVSEAKLLAWLRDEAARFRPPPSVELSVKSEQERAALDARRARIIDNYEDGLYPDKATRDMKLAAVDAALAKLEDQHAAVDVPATIDWTWPADAVNAVLRAYWEYVELDEHLRPVRAVWRVPEEWLA